MIEALGRGGVDTSVRFQSGAGSILDTANASERLSARLSGTAGTILKAAAPTITKETQEQAIKDVEAGNVNSESVASVARHVYTQTANAALLADVEVSSKSLGKGLVDKQTEANSYNVDSFNTEWNGYKKGTLESIKDVTIRKNVEQTLDKQGAVFSSQIATLQTKQSLKLQSENLLAKLNMDNDSLKAAFGVNDEEAVALTESIESTLATMVASNLIAPNTALSKRKQIFKGVYLAKQERDFTTALNNGTAHKFYKSFKTADHKGVLDSKDIVTFRNSMISQITNDVKLHDLQIKQEEDEQEIINKDTINEFNTAYIAGDLTPTEINEALANNKITITQHKEYLTKVNDSGALVNNTTKLLTVSSHLLDITEQEIIDSPDFTNSTKFDLLTKRRAEAEDEGNWLATQSGREGRRRIRENFNIIDGTMMSRLDFKNNTMREYDDMYRSFFAQVEALPLEQRANKSIEIADNLLKAFQQKKEDAKLAKVKKAEEDKAKAKAKATKDYNNSVTGKFMNMLHNKWSSTDAKKIQEQFE